MKKFSFVDLIIISGVIIALLVGFCTAKHFRQTADKQIEAVSPITFQVFLRGVTITGDAFPIDINSKT
jgi:positive regulator of sigma E activity